MRLTPKQFSLSLICLLAWGHAGQAQDADQVAFAKEFLAELNIKSINAGREYCGHFGYSKNGNIKATKPKRGRTDSCRPRDPGKLKIFASYHTHGSYDYDADSEVPSSEDVIGDMEDGINGFIATPGGRLWFVDGTRGEARLICGLDCLPADPKFEQGFMGHISKRYTLKRLKKREK